MYCGVREQAICGWGLYAAGEIQPACHSSIERLDPQILSTVLTANPHHGERDLIVRASSRCWFLH